MAHAALGLRSRLNYMLHIYGHFFLFTTTPDLDIEVVNIVIVGASGIFGAVVGCSGHWASFRRFDDCLHHQFVLSVLLLIFFGDGRQ